MSLLSRCFRSAAPRFDSPLSSPKGPASQPASSGPERPTASPVGSATPQAVATAPQVPDTDQETTAQGPVPAARRAGSGETGSPLQVAQQAPSQPSNDSQPASGRGSQSRGNSTRAGLHAPVIAVEASAVAECNPLNLIQGITLTSKELGRGSYGVVLAGSFRGLRVAVKVMVAPHLDKPALRELLLGPSVTHPNVVQTYTSRCATMTDEFFDYLEGGPRAIQEPGLPRLLLDIPLQSGDGFGAPGLLDGGVRQSTTALCRVLSDLKAATGQVAIVLVQELADVGTLGTAIVNKMFTPGENWSVRLARRALLRTGTEIARGVLHLHDAGLVHADLKPANVLLAASPQDRRGFTAKVSDFGLSHVIPPNASSVHTNSWGSVAYMSPESFAGRLSLAADVWAVGVILWEMLTGCRPFEGKSQADAIAAIRLSPEPLPWPINLPMSSGIVHLGRACMHRDPAQRPTMERVLHVLVGMEQCIRANLLLGPEAVMEILAGHSRYEDVEALVQRLVAAAAGSAGAGGVPGAQAGGVPQAVGPARAQAQAEEQQAAAMVQRQGSAVRAEAMQEPCAGTPERSLVVVDGIAVLAV